MKPNQIDEREARHATPVICYLLVAFVACVALGSLILAVAR